MSDFGFEHSFAKAIKMIREHYGVDVCVSTMADVSRKHAFLISEEEARHLSGNLLPAEGCENLLAETDGTFLRIVETSNKKKDRRKTRIVAYEEGRLCASKSMNELDIHYKATFKNVDDVGLLWAQSAKEAGRGLNTKVHVVSDGASWIKIQADHIFSKQQTFLIDFYHLCEYLFKASIPCSQNSKKWMRTQKKRLKMGHFQKVIKELEFNLENSGIVEEDAPVRKAYRYMTNRLSQFNYAEAIKTNLPIGSGLIESGHKHVLQARMKIPGASWNRANAEAFVCTRSSRANGQWNIYWEKKAA